MLFVLCLWNLVCNSLHILHPFAHCDWFIYSVENVAGEVHLVGSKTFCILWQVGCIVLAGKSKTGELSIFPSSIAVLLYCLHMLPKGELAL
jgi:hypothetical protein